MKALRNLEMKDFQTSGFLPCFLQAPISIMQAHPSCSPQAHGTLLFLVLLPGTVSYCIATDSPQVASWLLFKKKQVPPHPHSPALHLRAPSISQYMASSRMSPRGQCSYRFAVSPSVV